MKTDTKSLDTSVTGSNYAFLQKFIYDHSGIVIDTDKQYLLESRLLPIARDHRIGSLDGLAAALSSNPSALLSRLVIDAMTTNETLFFRDPVMFESLRNHILPGMFARVNGKRRIRIWSAASSTGQEAYSIAMTLLTMGKDASDVEIVGTDLSHAIVDRAIKGNYNQFEVGRGLTPAQLSEHFLATGSSWQLKDNLRAMVRFQQMDLRDDFAFLREFDLIFCRNVLIYFDTATKRQIVGNIRNLLSPEGFLVLGCAETIINIHDGFKRTVVDQSNYYSL